MSLSLMCLFSTKVDNITLHFKEDFAIFALFSFPSLLLVAVVMSECCKQRDRGPEK